MAKYTVTHRCGHDEVHNLTGPDTRYKDGLTRRQWIATRRAEEPCSYCKKTAGEERRAAETLAAADQAAELHLPTLTGSERQTAWAERIRADLIAKIDKYDSESPAEHTDISAGIRQVLMGAVARHTTARWWIDNRDTAMNALATELNPDENKAIDAWENLLRTREETTR
jgi:hypothetical protein